ncbi:uncharacterized protein DS421_9g277100 [Arachis hypogaea]|nr:uncharacterized protein DS421_9g277100 [Arachis hypogaea]
MGTGDKILPRLVQDPSGNSHGKWGPMRNYQIDGEWSLRGKWALWGIGMGSNIPPQRGTEMGTESKFGGDDGEKGGIPRPCPVR